MSRKTLIWTILIALFMLCLSCMLAYASVQRRSQVVSHVDIRIEREDILYLQETQNLLIPLKKLTGQEQLFTFQ